MLLAAVGGVLAVPADAARAGDAPRPIHVIVNDLVADEPAIRAKGAAELTDRFPDGAVAVPMLVDLLDDESPEVVAAAARSIDAMAIAGVTPVVEFLRDSGQWKPDTYLAIRTAWEFGVLDNCGADVFVLDDPYRPPEVAQEPAEPAMAALLTDRFGRTPAPSLLASMRGSKSDKVRLLAAAALSLRACEALAARRIAPAAHARRSEAEGSAVELLRDAADAKSWAGAQILGRLRSADPATLAALTETLTAKKTLLTSWYDRVAENHSRVSACRALGRLGTSAGSASGPLLELTSADAETAGEAADALLALGKETDLIQLLLKQPSTADSIEWALAKRGRGADVVVPLLVARLAGRDEYPQFLLRRFGPAAADALPALKALPVIDPLDAIRRAEVVLAIAPADSDGLRMLREALKSADPGIADRAIGVLATRGQPGPELVETLLAAHVIDSLDSRWFPESCDALGRCGPAANACVPALLRLLDDASRRGLDASRTARCVVIPRHAMTVCLGRIGPGAAAAIPVLTALRDKGDETIRVPGAQALRRIGAKK